MKTFRIWHVPHNGDRCWCINDGSYYSTARTLIELRYYVSIWLLAENKK